MAYIKFKDKETPIKAFVYPVLSQNRVQITTEEEPDTSGFSLFIDEKMTKPMDRGEYEGFTTLYRQGEGWYELSNDGSVYVEPVPVVNFFTFVGGKLDGETVQQAKSWEDIVVPTPVPDEGYIFSNWYPEIPSKGKISNDRRFTARFRDIRVYFEPGDGGHLDGERRQIVNDYSELVIPTPVANKDYKFTGWIPEIPTEGAIDLDTLEFIAHFESTISERLANIEGTLTDLNNALGGEE